MDYKIKLKQIAVWIGVTVLIITAVPLSGVQGQGFLSQTGSTSGNVQDLSEVVNEASVTSPTMVTVWQEYQTALEVLTFQNVHTTEWNGDTISDVKGKFTASVMPEEFTLEGTTGFTALLYTYQGATEESFIDTVEIGLIFVEGHLVFGALNNIVTDFSGENFIPTDLAEQFKTPGATIQDIAMNEPKVKAVAHMVVEDQAKDIIVMDSGTDLMDGLTNFYFIEDGSVTHHQALDIYTAMQGTITIMFDFMAFYYADGIVGQTPTEEPEAQWSWKDESESQWSWKDETNPKESDSQWSWKDASSDEHAETTNEDETQADSLVILDPLGGLMTEENIDNPQFFNVWHAYLQVLEQFEFRDLGSEELKGSLISDVESSFDLGVTPQRIDRPSDTMSVLIYEFKDEGATPFNSAGIAELTLYFADDLLAFAGISNRTSKATNDRLLTEVHVDLFNQGGATVQDVAAANPIILGMGYMVQFDSPISVVTIPSGISLSQANVDFYYIREGIVQGIETMTFEEASVDLPTHMFLNLADYFNAEEQE